MKKKVEVDNTGSPLFGHQEGTGEEYFEQLKRNIRRQLLLAYVTPLLFLALYFHFQYISTTTESIYNHLKSIAENRRNTVDLFLQERVANLRTSFSLNETDFAIKQDDMRNVLDSLRHESATFVDLGLFNPEGTLVSYAGPHPSLIGKDYSSEKWYQQLIKSDIGYYISDVYLGFRGKPHIIVAIRKIVNDKYWVLRASVDPQKFGEFVESSYMLEGAEAFIVNSTGSRQTLSGEIDETTETAPIATDRSSYVKEVSIKGRSYLRATAWLTENNWALVVRVPADRAYGTLKFYSLIIAGIMVIAIVFIIFVVNRSTDNLVGKLKKADEVKEKLRHQLFNAAKLASVGEMAAGVAHEINNPLAIIYEEASMIKDLIDPQFSRKLDPENLEDRIDAIIDATIRGRTITRKLLAFSRPHEPDPEPTNINILIDRVIEVKRADLSLSNISVHKDYSEELPLALVNRNQMDQVVLNLINNAIDAIDGEGQLTLRTRLKNNKIEIEVEDSGKGMTQEVMEQIFVPFFTTKGVGKGTGLGLSISYGIIKALNGEMYVKSQVDQGTTFSIVLPSVQDTPRRQGS